MAGITDIAPDILKERHRLSPKQINLLLGEGSIKESAEEKVATLEMVREFIRITDLLAVGGISFIPLKGPVLSFRLYGDATVRYFTDLDLFVDAPSISRVKGILEAENYQAIAPFWPEEGWRQQRLLKHEHHISFTHSEKLVTFEVHWRLLDRQYLNFKDFESLVKLNQSSIIFASRSFRVLNNELELLYLMIHGGVHHWGRLKWLADVHEFLKTQKTDWARFNEYSSRIQAGNFVGLCSKMLARYFPGGPTFPCSCECPAYMVSLAEKRINNNTYLTSETGKEILQNLWFLLLAYPGLGYKARMIVASISHSLFVGRINRMYRKS